MKSCLVLHSKRVKWRFALLITLLLSLNAVSTAYAGGENNCRGTHVVGPPGSATVGPTAIEIKAFTTEDDNESFSSIRSFLVIGAGVVLLLLAALRGYKLRKRK
jgi:hypothetical protein